MSRLVCLVTLGCLMIGSLVQAADPPVATGAVSYYKQIRPIFQTHCQGCHQPAKRGGEYVMTVFEQMLKGGESSEAAIVPGNAAKSNLVKQITPSGNEAAMPKGAKPLSAVEIGLISTWIAEGAKDDSPASTINRYDMAHPPVYQAAPVVTSLDYSPDGKLLAISGYHEVVLHNADGSGLAARLVGLSERIESAVFSPDGTKLAVTGGSPGRFGEVQVWDVAKKELKLSLQVGYDTIYGANWSPNGQYISFGCPDNTVRAIEAETGKQVLYNAAHNDWVLDTSFSVNNDYVISVSRDMSMKLVEVKTQRFIDNITSITPGALKGGLSALDRHPTKDEYLCGGSDGQPKLFKMLRTTARQIGDNANLLKEYQAMPGRVWSLSFSPDGNLFAAGSSNDGTGEVRVYSTGEGKIISQLNVPESGIYAVAFSRDGATVAAGGFDGDVRLVKAGDGTLVKKFTPMQVTTKVAGK
jgi:WD40 repeat protein/mono/diheme cytochrome c family protein